MTTISNIRNDIFRDGTTKRIVVKMKTKPLDPEDYRASAYDIVSEIFPDWTKIPRLLSWQSIYGASALSSSLTSTTMRTTFVWHMRSRLFSPSMCSKGKAEGRRGSWSDGLPRMNP